jgi:hypothetical protein
MNLSGDWTLELDFLLGKASHALQLEQNGDVVTGRFRSQYGEQQMTGNVQADGRIHLRSSVHYQACGAPYIFHGRATGDHMEGELSLGEFWTAAWRADRQT